MSTLDLTHDVTHHIISNAEIGMTECGRMVAYRNVDEPTPWPIESGAELAIWDNDEPPAGSWTCAACAKAYDS